MTSLVDIPNFCMGLESQRGSYPCSDMQPVVTLPKFDDPLVNKKCACSFRDAETVGVSLHPSATFLVGVKSGLKVIGVLLETNPTPKSCGLSMTPERTSRAILHSTKFVSQPQQLLSRKAGSQLPLPRHISLTRGTFPTRQTIRAGSGVPVETICLPGRESFEYNDASQILG